MKKLNNTQKALKRMIRDTESKITDEELFLSSAFQKYQTSLAKTATGRSRYGLQVLMEWDSSENADIAYTDNYRIHCNAANSITQSFPSRFLRSQSLTGLTGHEIGHLRYSDFASLQLYLTNMENGSFYPEAPDNLPSGYKANLQDILDAMEEKDNATCLTLSRCAAQFNNILEDIYIEARMCEEYPGTFKQGIQINNLRMSELIPSIQEQIDCGYQPFSIMSNLILSYCRTGNINNRTNYSGEYTDTLSDCMDYIDDALIATQGKERLRASNYLLVLCWNYIQPMVELTRESLKKQDSTQIGDALEDLLRKESGSGSPLPTGKNGGIPKNIPGPTVKSKTPITCDLSGLDPNYRQDAINQAEKVLQEEGGRIELAKTTAVLDGNNPGITYASQYAGSGYENAANDLARILNDVATEKAQNGYEQELTEDLQKSADEIHYGNAHAGIHVTIHRINPVSDFFIKSYQTVASPLLRTSKRLQSSILPLLKEEAEGGKQKNLLFGKRLDMRALYRKDGGIFTRTRLPDEEQKLSVGLLVDESGSMGWGDRITHARKTAIVLYDFCMSLGIPITIYGHSTDSKGVALYSYAEFDSLDASDRYRLIDMSARTLLDPMSGSGTSKAAADRYQVRSLLYDLNPAPAYGKGNWNALKDEVEDSADLIFFHPPYHNMIQYSGNIWGNPHPDDLSRCENYSDFLEKLNHCIRKFFLALRKGGRLAILVGDMRLHGKFYSMQHDLMRMGDFESFLVKGQFNCVSDNRTYKKPFIPIVTEYALLLKKTDSFIIPFSIRQEGVFSVQNTDILALTWHHLIRMTMESIGGRGALKDLYALLKEHPKAKKNPHYQERIRATLYEHPDEYIPVSKGYFRLSYSVT